MNYFKKMLGIRRLNSDGWAANYGVANKAGYGRTSKGFKELINRDRRAKKKWVKNHENKLIQREEIEYQIDSSSDMSEHICPEKEEYLYKHYYSNESEETTSTMS